MGYRVVSSGPRNRSELEQFAMSFHQDWGILFPTFEEAAHAYLRSLWWVKLGAQGGPTNLKDSLRLIVEQI